jgi:hypothetical protein
MINNLVKVDMKKFNPPVFLVDIVKENKSFNFELVVIEKHFKTLNDEIQNILTRINRINSYDNYLETSEIQLEIVNLEVQSLQEERNELLSKKLDILFVDWAKKTIELVGNDYYNSNKDENYGFVVDFFIKKARAVKQLKIEYDLIEKSLNVKLNSTPLDICDSNYALTKNIERVSDGISKSHENIRDVNKNLDIAKNMKFYEDFIRNMNSREYYLNALSNYIRDSSIK